VCRQWEVFLGFLPVTYHFGSFVCIYDSPNGGEIVKNQALTVGTK
jgi:hypothetical protein